LYRLLHPFIFLLSNLIWQSPSCNRKRNWKEHLELGQRWLWSGGGDSEYMTKALTLFDSYPHEHIEVLPHGGSQSKPLGHRLFYQGPRHALEYCLKEHLFFLSSKYNLAPPIDHPNYASQSKPIWNENRKMNHEGILKWWHRNKTIFTDTRDPLIDQLIAQKID
jgi:hypothetical protein